MEGWCASDRNRIVLFGEDLIVGVSWNESCSDISNIIVRTVGALYVLAVVTTHKNNYNRQFSYFYYL